MKTGQDLMDYESKMDEIKQEIREKFPETIWPEPVQESVYFGKLSKVMIPKRKAILDANTGKVWDIVSDDYSMIPHEKVLYDVLSGLPIEMGKPDVKISLWADGARFRASVLFPEIEMDKEIKKGDLVRPRISVSSSYDRALLQEIQMGAEQLVCSNGLVIFKVSDKSKRKHINGAKITPEMLASMAEDFIEDYSVSVGQWQKWANTRISKMEIDEVLSELPFSEPELERIRHLPLMNNDNKFIAGLADNTTLWDINSAATQFAKHEVRGTQRAIELETVISITMSRISERF